MAETGTKLSYFTSLASADQINIPIILSTICKIINSCLNPPELCSGFYKLQINRQTKDMQSLDLLVCQNITVVPTVKFSIAYSMEKQRGKA